jgi:hypothetical protein
MKILRYYKQQQTTAFQICEAILDTYKERHGPTKSTHFDLAKEFDKEWTRRKNDGKKPEG